MRGFTLIEIVIVVGILGLVLALGLFMSLDSYRGFLNRSEVSTVVSILLRARSHAVNNVYQAGWGVCYIAPNYILYRGTACATGLTTNETLPANQGATIAGLAAPGVRFSALDGTTTAATITVVQNGKTSTITLNNEGRIDW